MGDTQEVADAIEARTTTNFALQRLAEVVSEFGSDRLERVFMDYLNALESHEEALRALMP